ncbi:MAG: hypothetical protein AB8F78_13690 [Saprospiraceae bacterium]
MRFLTLLTILFLALLTSCGADKPLPVIFDLVDGVVTTELFEEVALENHMKEGVTELFLMPTGAEDVTGDKISLMGRKRATGFGTYMMGYAGEVFLASNDPINTYLIMPASSLSKGSVDNFEAGASASTVAEKIKSNYMGKRIVLVGGSDFLTDVANQVADTKVLKAWPKEGLAAVVHVSVGGPAPTATAFGLVTDREN